MGRKSKRKFSDILQEHLRNTSSSGGTFMGLQTYSNATALGSMNALNMHGSPLKNALERISSGIRINQASDDASGMAISEKMRNQIQGINRAIRNSQDGISLIQTAEGALQETTAILQRMRELSVQAATSSINASDRQEIQREVDQLIAEVDRISSSTEFNTKKLLSGEGTATWRSTDPDRISAIIRDRVVSGNYRIDVEAKVGKNQVLKSNIMVLQPGAYAGDIITSGTLLGDVANNSGVVGIYEADNLRTGTADQRIYKVNVAAASAGAPLIQGMPPEIFSTVGDLGSIMGTYQQPGSQFMITGTEFSDTAVLSSGEMVFSSGINLQAGVHGYLEIEFMAGVTIESGATDVDPQGVRIRFIDVKTGNMGDWAMGTLDRSGFIDLDTNNVNGWRTLTSGGQVPLANIFDNTDPLDNRLYFGDGSTIKTGDKILLSIDAAEHLDGTLTVGGGAIKIDERFMDNGVEREIRGAYYVSYTANGLQHTALSSGNKQILYHLPQLDESTGAISIGSITLDMRPSSTGTMTDSNLAIELRGEGGIASTYTRLKDIQAFQTAEGINTFELPQRIMLYGNSKRTELVLNGNDTIAMMVDKFARAITHKTEGLGINLESVTINKHVADFISRGEAISESQASIEGTFFLRSLFNGLQGEISMVADQRVIDAFNFHELQQSQENEYTVEVFDAHRGTLIGSALVANGIMEGVLQGADILIEGNIGVTASWNSRQQSLEFEANQEKSTTYLNLVDTALVFQVGPNEKQDIVANISQLDARALGIANLVLVTEESAAKAITQVDRAIELVNTERSRLGAIGNRLDHTVNNLSVAEQSLQHSESRIRDTDMANEISTLTSKQVLSEAARAMLAQANQMPRGLIQLLNNQ